MRIGFDKKLVIAKEDDEDFESSTKYWIIDICWG